MVTETHRLNGGTPKTGMPLWARFFPFAASKVMCAIHGDVTCDSECDKLQMLTKKQQVQRILQNPSQVAYSSISTCVKMNICECNEMHSALEVL